MIFQVLNFLRRQISQPHQETYEGYLPYFADDQFPLKWHKAISESPSATSCVSTLSDFLEGHGLTDEDLSKRSMNSDNETFWQIHHKTCQSLAEFEGFYWHFMFNAAGKITEMRVLPFESCRLGKPDSSGIISSIFYNPYFGDERVNDYKKNTKVFRAFDLNAVRSQIKKDGANYKGQVLFVGKTTPNSRFYPLPRAYSAIKWMKSEAGIADYHEDNIVNGLHQPYIVVMKGNPNDPSQNPEYSDTTKPITVGEEFNLLMQQNFMGAKRVGNVWVQWVNNTEEAPEIIPIPTNANGDFFISLDNQATKKITVAFNVMAILANINEGVSLGGDGNTIRVAVKLMQQRVTKDQRILSQAYEMVLRQFEVPYVNPVVITPYNPYPELEVIDDKIWQELTAEERRKWIDEHTEIELDKQEEVATPAQPAPANFRNSIPVGWPESIRNNIQKALDYDETHGKGCGKKAGREVAMKIVNNENLPLRQIKRIYSYVKKRNNLADSPWEDCEVVMYNQWGGRAMELFLENKLKEVEAWLN